MTKKTADQAAVKQKNEISGVHLLRSISRLKEIRRSRATAASRRTVRAPIPPKPSLTEQSGEGRAQEAQEAE